jgi:hypothetical protein
LADISPLENWNFKHLQFADPMFRWCKSLSYEGRTKEIIDKLEQSAGRVGKFWVVDDDNKFSPPYGRVYIPKSPSTDKTHDNDPER